MILRVAKIVWKRLQQDNLKMRSGYLAYVTLLSIVPLLSVVIAVLSIFPFFQAIYTQFQSLIYRNFVPHASEVAASFVVFLSNASKVSLLGLVVLIVLFLF